MGLNSVSTNTSHYANLIISGVVKGGRRGGAIAPPIVFKTILTKSLNPCRSWGWGGGGTRSKIQTQNTVLPLKYGIIHLTFVQIIKNIECADHPSLCQAKCNI